LRTIIVGEEEVLKIEGLRCVETKTDMEEDNTLRETNLETYKISLISNRLRSPQPI